MRQYVQFVLPARYEKHPRGRVWTGPLVPEGLTESEALAFAQAQAPVGVEYTRAGKIPIRLPAEVRIVNETSVPEEDRIRPEEVAVDQVEDGRRRQRLRLEAEKDEAQANLMKAKSASEAVEAAKMLVAADKAIRGEV